MKTAISIPDALFQKAEILARKSKLARSQLYTRAIAEYISRHCDEKVTESYDSVYGSGHKSDKVIPAQANRMLKKVEW